MSNENVAFIFAMYSESGIIVNVWRILFGKLSKSLFLLIVYLIYG